MKKEGLYVEVEKLNVPLYPDGDKLTLSCVWDVRVACYHDGKRLWSKPATPGSKHVFKKDAMNEATTLLRELLEGEGSPAVSGVDRCVSLKEIIAGIRTKRLFLWRLLFRHLWLDRR